MYRVVVNHDNSSVEVVADSLSILEAIDMQDELVDGGGNVSIEIMR